MTRTLISSGGPWEERVGYSRAVRVDGHVWVSGTTGTHPDGTIPVGTEAQRRLALDTIEQALVDAGASIGDVVAVRIYVVDIKEWARIGGVLRERFGDVRPAMAMVEVSRLLATEHRVEIEVEAAISAETE